MLGRGVRQAIIFLFLLGKSLLLYTKRRNIGGQAVIEGVMMRANRTWAVAVRARDGAIHTMKENLRPLPMFLKLPLIRGTVALVQSVVLGIKAIDFSASKAYEEEGEISPLMSGITITIALLLGIGLFIFLPLYLTKILGSLFSMVKESTLLFNLTDGIIRVVIFILYIYLIGLWSEMRRIYEYHGAEHKVIHAYEDGAQLEAETIATKYSPQHPRCGTSFLLIVMIISILVFSFIPHHMGFIEKLGLRMLLIPLVAGLSYEILKVSAKRSQKGIFRYFIIPGIMLQRLTTREPDKDQIEVALTSLTTVIEEQHA